MSHSIMIIAVMALVNITIRALPFILFRKENKTPKSVEYLGKVLPPAMMSFLIIYCIRSVDVSAGTHGIPELIGIATAMILHAWKRNTLLSIGTATVVYMILVQFVFNK